jgi:iron only hydrogenase large subunit-like protein
VVNGIGHVPALLEDIDSKRLSVHFVEVMSCPGGCVAGGGQPYDTDLDAVRRRIARLQEADRRARQRASHASDSIETLYQKVLGTPGGQASHHMLHRHYVDRTLPEGAVER